jgi:phage gpG-like protein
MRVTIDTDTLDRLGEAFRDPRIRRTAASRAAVEHLLRVQRAFGVSGVDPETGAPGAWPDLATGAASVLQDTGRLLGGISFEASADGWRIGPEPLPYAPVHQLGSEAQGIPARPYIVFPRPWRKDIASIYAAELVSLVVEETNRGT